MKRSFEIWSSWLPLQRATISNICLFSILFISKGLFAQVSFSEFSDLLPYRSNSGNPLGIVDLNRDGLDDVIRLDQGNMLQIGYQQVGGLNFRDLSVGEIGTQPQWSICAADINNDGMIDFFIGGFREGAALWISDQNGYKVETLPGADFYVQGSNFHDVDRDGWVDLFVCNDDGLNLLYQNKQGSFEPVDWIDFRTEMPSDNSGNYSAIWEDFNSDGLDDLYLVKCRAGVEDATDPRRINTLYVRDRDSLIFEESAARAGLALGEQSWSVDAGDYDNDGDMDLLVTNHKAPSVILSNDGQGRFEDVTLATGVNIVGIPLQGVFMDLDCDGFLDIITAGSAAQYFHNQGDGTFLEIRDAWDGRAFTSLAVGDLNSDGYLDLFTSYAHLVNIINGQPDLALISSGSDHHYLQVVMQGTTSNRAGIGARLKAYGPWGCQTRTVRSGASYGIMNTLTQHFGLGSAMVVDSLVILWPSGQRDVYTEVVGDQQYLAQEGKCLKPYFKIDRSTDNVLCTGDTIQIGTNIPAEQFEWSNGVSSAFQPVFTDRYLNLRVVHSDGCEQRSYPEWIDFDPEWEADIFIMGDTINCLGSEVKLGAEPQGDLLWSDGSTSDQITVYDNGDFAVRIAYACTTKVSDTLHIRFSDPQLGIVTDTVEVGGVATLFAAGSEVSWFSHPESNMPVARGNYLVTEPLDSSKVYYVDVLDPLPERIFKGGMDTAKVNFEVRNHLVNQAGRLFFDVYRDVVLKSVVMGADSVGTREVLLRNAQDVIIQRQEVELKRGWQTVDLGWMVPAGKGYQLATSESANIAQFGHLSPNLWYLPEGNYPLHVEDLLSITGNNTGQEAYYYFFDWVVAIPTDTCAINRVPVKAVVNTNTTLSLIASEDVFIQVYPNPFRNRITVEAEQVDMISCQIRDAAGLLLYEWSGKADTHQIYPPELSAGLYFLYWRSSRGTTIRRLIRL